MRVDAQNIYIKVHLPRRDEPHFEKIRLGPRVRPKAQHQNESEIKIGDYMFQTYVRVNIVASSENQ